MNLIAPAGIDQLLAPLRRYSPGPLPPAGGRKSFLKHGKQICAFHAASAGRIGRQSQGKNTISEKVVVSRCAAISAMAQLGAIGNKLLAHKTCLPMARCGRSAKSIRGRSVSDAAKSRHGGMAVAN